jgi:hypothetical protein
MTRFPYYPTRNRSAPFSLLPRFPYVTRFPYVAEKRRQDRVRGGREPRRWPASVQGREEHFIPLRAELVELLRPRNKGRPPTAPVFDVPKDLIKRFITPQGS